MPSANSSIILRLNAGISSGLRLETNPLSTTTSSSTHFAPALIRSCLTDHSDRLSLIKKETDERHRVRVHPQLVRVSDSARQHQGVKIVNPRIRQRHVDRELVPFVIVVPSLHLTVHR